MADVLNYDFKCGATNYLSFVLMEHSDPLDNTSPLVPVDLTGKTARCQIRWKVTDDVPILTATTEDGKIVIDPLVGRVDITFAPAETELLTLKPKTAVFDVEIITTPTDVDRPAQGTVTFDPNVTR